MHFKALVIGLTLWSLYSDDSKSRTE